MYFPGHFNDRAATVERSTGVVTEVTPIGLEVGRRQTAFDGTSIYLPAKQSDEIVVVDATTFEVTDILQTLGLNSLEYADGTLWTANNVSGFVQAFDRPA